MFGGGAAVTLVADDDNVQVYAIEKHSLDEIFKIRPEIACKFYKFLATQIGNRFHEDLMETTSERKARYEVEAHEAAVSFISDKKRGLTDWWLVLIKQKCTEFLEELGYHGDAVPERYLDTPPASMEKVKSNLVVIQQLLDRSEDRFNMQKKLIEPLKQEIYDKIDQYLVKAEKILEESNQLRDDKKIDLEFLRTQDANFQIENIVKDVEYLNQMKKLEFNFFEKDSTSQMKQEMSHIVPITGLIVGRFHRLHNELQSVMELWDK